MGLLNRILKKQGVKKGLLNKADSLVKDRFRTEKNTEKTLTIFTSFHHIVQDAHLLKAGIFVPCGLMYKMIFSHGYDSDTVMLSHSTSDFWHGTVSGHSWNTFSKEKLSPFYQFFSSSERDSLTAVHIKPFLTPNKALCYFLISETADTGIIDTTLLDAAILQLSRYIDMSRCLLKEHFALNEDILITEEKIENGVELGKPVLFSISFEKLFNAVSPPLTMPELQLIRDELFYTLKKNIDTEDICRIDNFNVKYAFFSYKPTETSFRNSLLYTIGTLIEEKYFSFIEITQLIKPYTIAEIKHFLLSE